MDAGIIAKTKGKGRRLHGRWATEYTLAQLNAGVIPEDIRLPFDAQSCKQNLTAMWSQATGELDKAGIEHCWESCCEKKLLTAWDADVQATAVSQKYFLFPKTAPALEATEPECTSTGAGLCEDYDEDGEEEDFIDEILEHVDEEGSPRTL